MALCNHGDIWPVSSGKQKKTPSSTTSTARRHHAESLESTSAQNCIQRPEIQPQKFEKQNIRSFLFKCVWICEALRPSSEHSADMETVSAVNPLVVYAAGLFIWSSISPWWASTRFLSEERGVCSATWAQGSRFSQQTRGLFHQRRSSSWCVTPYLHRCGFQSDTGPWRHHFLTSLHTRAECFYISTVFHSFWMKQHLLKNNLNTVKRKFSTWIKWFFWLNYSFFSNLINLSVSSTFWRNI